MISMFARRVSVATAAVTLLAAGSAFAVVGLPADNSQVNALEAEVEHLVEAIAGEKH